jgi:serine/threonine-protein kinase ULK/ATG1
MDKNGMQGQPLFVSHGYEFLEEIGHGGEGEVYRVRSQRYNEIFAAKVLAGIHSLEEVTEFESIRRICHTNVIRCYDAFAEENRVILVYEYCRGGTLEEEVRSHGPGGLPLERFKAVARQLVAGLWAIHKRGLAHCDVKPQNVLLADAAGSVAKLSDFGMTCPGGPTREIVGTPLFWSPEIWSGHRHDPQLADVWALGVSFVYMLQGSLPFTGQTDVELRDRVINGEMRFTCADREIEALARRMLLPEGRRIRMKELRRHPLFAPARLSSARSTSMIRATASTLAGPKEKNEQRRRATV